MNNSPALEERVTKLEYFVFEQLPPKMAAMDFAATQIYALTQANGDAIAGLRVDMAAFKATLDLQGDSLRKQIGVTRAEVLSGMSAFRERVDQRFERVGGQIDGFRADVDQRFQAVDQRFDTVDQRFQAVDQRFQAVDQRFDTVDQRFDALDSKIDSLIAEIRNGKNGKN